MTEVEKLKEDIDVLIDLLVSLDLNIVCEDLLVNEWGLDEFHGDTWCERNCGRINDGTCTSKECYLEYLKMKRCNKHKHNKSFLEEFNKNLISDEMLEKCRKTDELFKRK